MNKSGFNIKIWIILGFISISLSGYSQLIHTENIEISRLDTSNEENILLDINDEICSIVLVRTALDGLKFYSNRGIEKVRKTEYGYKVFIPAESKQLKISVPGSPLYEHILPETGFDFSIYKFDINVSEDQQIIYSDITLRSLTITTNPENLRLTINGVKSGRTPYYIQDPQFNRFEYSIKKLGYKSQKGTDSVNTKNKTLKIDLIDLHRTPRLFVIQNIGIEHNDIVGDRDHYSSLYPHFGLTVGRFGGTGFFLSFKWADRKAEDSYYDYMNEFRKYSMTAGITQQITKNLFLTCGLGYLYRYYDTAIGSSSSGSTIIIQSRQNADQGLTFEACIVIRIAWYGVFHIGAQLMPRTGLPELNVGIGVNVSNFRFSNS